ncbi:TRAFs-binding domain-containing protein [Desertibaculum subflavum]|uniref:TRAFs-binding domain-containing protein n=1 Tax=Desertibaculum subflavum TaxID=2268458 RepID=UPI000E668DA4
MTTEAEVRAAMNAGDLFRACDLANAALAAAPGDRALQYLVVLALARAGATEQALERYRDFGLRAERFDTQLDIDIASISGRLLKDRALLAAAADRPGLLAAAAAEYERVYASSGKPFPGVNAATLHRLAGNAAAAGRIAGAVVATLGQAQDYWGEASLAEAKAVLGDQAGASAALTRAARFLPDEGARASTLRQLRLLGAALGWDAAWLAPIKPRTAIHFSGHIIGPRFPPEAVPVVATAIEAALAAHDVGFAYGSLAAGADILFAEAVLARGGELHVVLPFDAVEFRATSVAPAGGDWLARFEACLARATSINFATTDAFLADDGLYAYASRMAMGLARLRAGFLQGEAMQIAVWDGQPGNGVAGAAADIAAWAAVGGPAQIIRVQGAPGHAAAPARQRREVHAMLFGDVRGFSKLTEAELPRFVGLVLGGFARVAERYDARILLRNTWGDGLFIVVEDASTAAALALELQGAMRGIDLAAAGLPDYLALRLGGHVGPVFRLTDPVLGRDNFFGVHVSRTARIEPVTPPGAVYVTEQFAADLAARGETRFQCDYVGLAPAAKGYGDMRFYALKSRGAVAAA